jgi:hypothetical protein
VKDFFHPLKGISLIIRHGVGTIKHEIMFLRGATPKNPAVAGQGSGMLSKTGQKGLAMRLDLGKFVVLCGFGSPI